MQINSSEVQEPLITAVDYKQITTNHQGDIHISWNYKQHPKCFLIHICNAKVAVGIKDIIDEWVENYGDKDLSFNVQHPVYELKERDRGKLFCIREEEYRSFGQKMILSAKHLSSGCPYIFRIYACDYDYRQKVLKVHEQIEQNFCYFPVILRATIREKRQWFSPYKGCFIYIPSVPDYKNGAFLYQVGNSKHEFPIPGECLNHEFYAQVPKESLVTVKASEEFGKYYQIQTTRL